MDAESVSAHARAPSNARTNACSGDMVPNMVMVVAPHKNKSEVKTEQNAQRAANKEAARSARNGSDPEAEDESGSAVAE